jgi:hypothetical protein
VNMLFDNPPLQKYSKKGDHLECTFLLMKLVMIKRLAMQWNIHGILREKKWQKLPNFF